MAGPRSLVISDALVNQPREGAQVLAEQIGHHCVTMHGSQIAKCEPDPSSTDIRLNARWLGIQLLLKLFLTQYVTITYIPQSGLTVASFLRAVIIVLIAHPKNFDLVVMQLHYYPPPLAAKACKHWQISVGTQADYSLLTKRNYAASLLRPRVPRSKISTATSRSTARKRVQWSDGLHFLHVGHPRKGRNLGALKPLTQYGTLHLLLSDYKSDEDGALTGLTSSAKIVRGYQENLGDIYKAADVYVFPTVNMKEVISLPMSVFEALANGTPVVARASEALFRWRDMAGLHLVDSDARLVEVALEIGRSSVELPSYSENPNRCDDLYVCRRFLEG